MEEVNVDYKKHVLVCTKTREETEACCANVEGEEIFMALKKYVIENGLVKEVYITNVKCLGMCNYMGTTIVIYHVDEPDRLRKQWFLGVQSEDLEEIINEINPVNDVY